MNQVVCELPTDLPLSIACKALGINRSSVYAHRARRTRGVPPQTSRVGTRQPRALSRDERARVLSTLHSPEYCDQPPAQVDSHLLEQGTYLCSVSTMHRVLRSANENGDRRAQRPAQQHAITRLQASRPNEVWTWDITKLAKVHREYLSLHVVMDLYSRFVVAWMLSRKENSALAQQLMEEALLRYRIAPGGLTIHQDRGAPMTAHAYLDLMGELGATCSHSRPRVSNDNAFSESQFKTQKYQPDYPGRFDHYAHGRSWCEAYFDWYNFSHHHSGLAMYTPEQVFTGRHVEIAAIRQQALDEQYRKHPERFVLRAPKASLPPQTVFINPVCQDDGTKAAVLVNFPTLPAAIERQTMLTSR